MFTGFQQLFDKVLAQTAASLVVAVSAFKMRGYEQLTPTMATFWMRLFSAMTGVE